MESWGEIDRKRERERCNSVKWKIKLDMRRMCRTNDTNKNHEKLATGTDSLTCQVREKKRDREEIRGRCDARVYNKKNIILMIIERRFMSCVISLKTFFHFLETSCDSSRVTRK